MRNIGLLANPGGYDGTSGELSDDERKRLRAMAALQMGASMLANNQGNYGAFAPVLGVGLQNGLASYQANLERMKKDAEQRRIANDSRNAYQAATTPATPARYNIGQSQTATEQDAAVQSGNAPTTFGSFQDMGIAPNTLAALSGQPLPKSQFNLQDYIMPKQDVSYTPESKGRFDPAAYAENLIASGSPELYEKGIGMMTALGKADKPVVVGRSLIDPNTGKTIATDEAWKGEQLAAREQRIEELKMRLSDQQLSREQNEALRRELANQQIALRYDLAAMSSADRAASREIALATLAQGGKPQFGYRYTQEGNLEAVPGGPADIKAGELGDKREKKQQMYQAQAKNVLNAIGDAKSLVGLTTTGIGGLARNLPMTGARDLDAKLTTIKANLGFDRLQEMRDLSPTGGALGQVAVQELQALQATVASLDQYQSPKELRKSLDKIEQHYSKWLKTTESAGQANNVTKPVNKRQGYEEYVRARGQATTKAQRDAIDARARQMGVIK